MRQDEDAVTKVAEAVSDGKAVDWNAERAAHGHLAGTLERLRLIEAVAAAHQAPFAEEARVDERTTASLETAPTVDLPVPPVTRGETPAAWGPLRIVEPLGSGAFGEVYRAYDPSLRREVALKLLRTEKLRPGADAERFIREARQLARVRHSGILVVHGADEHDGRAGLWTDLLRGKTLEEDLAARGTLDAREAALIGIDLCQALAAVHAAGLVHRDVKTANIMREQGGHIVLMDFGCVTKRPAKGAVATSRETISGTPFYMAPEQILSAQPATPASDIYALGVVLYRLVSGRFPLEANTWAELYDMHRKGARIPLGDVRTDSLPAPFVQVVERALAADPARRYASAGAMGQALAAVIGAIPVVEAVNVKPTAPERSKRAFLYATLAAAVVVAVVAGAVFIPGIWRAPFTAEATLYRKGEGTDERLRTGSRVHPGDALFLEIEGREPMYVYVLNEDEMGSAYVLFPAGTDLDNPLSAGSLHRLPGRIAGTEMTWEITSAGSKENFLVVASRNPLEELENDIARLPQAQVGRQVSYAPVSPESLEGLRGIGGMRPEMQAQADSGGQMLSEISEGLKRQTEAVGGVWTWLVQLDNPAM